MNLILLQLNSSVWKHVQAESRLRNIYESGPYRKENTTLRHRKNQLINAVSAFWVLECCAQTGILRKAMQFEWA